VELPEADLRAAGIAAAYALVDEASHDQEAFDAPGPLLERLGARIAREHLGGAPVSARPGRQVGDGARSTAAGRSE
jgi:hypothetical protein